MRPIASPIIASTASPHAEIEISLSAFRSNLDYLRRVTAPADLMVVLKANAYGHGRIEMGTAAAAAGIRWLGALDLDTALALRSAGVTPEIRILAWLYPPGQIFSAAVAASIDLGVSTVRELEQIISTAGGQAPRVHLKIDTGLSRNGATAADWPKLVRSALRHQHAGLIKVVGVWTHIAEASEDDDTVAANRFAHAIQVAESLGAQFEVRHLAASSAGLRREDFRFDLVRMGGHCWGIPSFDGVSPREIGLEPVMTLRSRVVGVRDTGNGIRAFVPVGYALGVPSKAAGKVSVAIDGRLHRVVTVERHWLEVDTGRFAVSVGQRVVLFGTGDEGEQTVRQWGDLTTTLGDEITTRISHTIKRRYIE